MALKIRNPQSLPLFLMPLREPRFRSLWTANLISNIGTWMQQMGASWLMASLTSSAMMVSLVQTANTIPMFFIAIPAGVFADLNDKRKVLLFSQTFMAMAAFLLGVMVYYDKVGPWELLFFVFLLAMGSAMNMPAWQSAVSALMKDPLDLPQMASLNNMSFNLGRSVGPALAGFLFAWMGAAWLFLINAASFIGVIWVFVKWSREKRTEEPAQGTFWAALNEGFQICRSSQRFKFILIRSFSFFFFGTSLWSLLPLIARDVLRQTSSGFGFMMACLGVGAVIAAILLPYFRQKRDPTQVIEFSTFVFAVSSSIVAKSGNYALTCFVLVACGMTWAAMVSQLNAAAQVTFPMQVRSRALAIYFVVFYFALGIGSLVFGKIAEMTSVQMAIWIASGGLLASLPILRKVRL